MSVVIDGTTGVNAPGLSIEGTEEEWKAKRQEIRERFPYPVPPDAEI